MIKLVKLQRAVDREELRFPKRRCLRIQSENTTVDRYHSGRLRKQFRPLGPRPE